jgi:hypothetical protein
MRRPLIVITAILFTNSAPLRAQLAEALPGARVRVEAPGILAGRFVGTVLQRSPDTLRVGSPNNMPVDVPIARVSSIEISRGSSRLLGTGHGAMWGGAIGLVIGIAGTASCGDCYFGARKEEMIVQSALGGAELGAIIGAIIGRERWERFNLAPRPALRVYEGRPAIGLSLRI